MNKTQIVATTLNKNAAKNVSKYMMHKLSIFVFAMAFFGAYNTVNANEYFDIDTLPRAGYEPTPSPCISSSNTDIDWLPSNSHYFESVEDLYYSANGVYISVYITVRYVYRVLDDGTVEIQPLEIILNSYNGVHSLNNVPKEVLLSYAYRAILNSGNVSGPDIPSHGVFSNKIIQTTKGSCWGLTVYEPAPYVWEPWNVANRPRYYIPSGEDGFPKPLGVIPSNNDIYSTVHLPVIIGEFLFGIRQQQTPVAPPAKTQVIKKCEDVECCTQIFNASRDAEGNVKMEPISPATMPNCPKIKCGSACNWSNYTTDMFVGIYDVIPNSIKTELTSNQLIFEVTSDFFDNNLRFEIVDSYGNVKFNREVFVTSSNNVITSIPLINGNYICGVFLGSELLYSKNFVVE